MDIGIFQLHMIWILQLAYKNNITKIIRYSILLEDFGLKY